MIDHKLNGKTLLVFAVLHAVFLAMMLAFSIFQPEKVSDRTIELVSLPSSSGGAIEEPSSMPAASTLAKTSPPTPSLPAPTETAPDPPKQPPFEPPPEKPTPIPAEKKTPAPPKKTEIKTETKVAKETVQKPQSEKTQESQKKSAPVKVQVSNKVVSFDQPKTTTPQKSASQTGTSSTPASFQSASDYKQQLAGDIKGALRNVGEGAANAGTYLELVASTLKASWDKPDVPKGTHLFVRLTILPDGTIVPGSITQESPIEAMNESVRRLLQKSLKVPQPLPPGLGSPNYIATIRFVMD